MDNTVLWIGIGVRTQMFELLCLAVDAWNVILFKILLWDEYPSSIEYPLQFILMPQSTDLLILFGRVNTLSFNKIYMEITRKMLSIRQEQLTLALLKVVLEVAWITYHLPS